MTPYLPIAPFLTWSYDDNRTGWGLLLGETREGVKRLEYARRLAATGVDCELHVYPGCPHGLEVFAPDAEISQHAIEQRLRVIRSI